MTAAELQVKPKEEIFDFIRHQLKFKELEVDPFCRYLEYDVWKKVHLKFEMSGYENETGCCTIHNLNIVNKFANLGIYDFTEYLFLDFYKGHGTLYLKYWGDNNNLEFELGGYGTTEIIYEIFQKTVFSGKQTRRRD